MNTKRLTLTDPTVKFEASWVGDGAKGTLVAYRKKRDGSYEEFAITFEDLAYSELACIGRGVRVVLEEMQANAVERTQWAIDRVRGD